MKRIFIVLLLCISLKSQSQLIADPALEQITFTDLSGNNILDTMPLGYVAQLNVPIKNLDAGNGLPAGSCKIKIGLGTKLILAPSFDLSTVISSEYFQWTSSYTGGQVQITGELIAALPANYAVVAKFNVQGSVLEYSTITTNFLVTNHNTAVILSDQDPANNTSFRQYKIIPPFPIPVNISDLSAVNDNCTLTIAFNADNEVNVKRYVIEIAKDGSAFSESASLPAANRLRYRHNLAITPAIASPKLHIRIKAIDWDGTSKYSETKVINTLCHGNNTVYTVYPNPVYGQNYVTIKNTGSTLNGVYSAQLYDAKGTLTAAKQFVFSNQQQFDFPLNNIASGRYILKLKSDTGYPIILSIQKQ